MIEGREVEIEVDMEKMPAEVKPASSWHGPLASKPVSWGSVGAWQEEEDQGLFKKEVRLLFVIIEDYFTCLWDWAIVKGEQKHKFINTPKRFLAS